ncbi:MAG: phosphoribosylformylglycinamidine synthase subunit PurQ [Acidimicrobiales bacterium]
MTKPRVLIPVALGTNRDHDLALAFEAAGAEATSVPLTALRSGEVALTDFQMLGVPGGFSYGDALGAGRLLGLDLGSWFADQLAEAVAREMPIIGVCNGFQALVSAGLLPGAPAKAVLTENQSHVFECRWVMLQPGLASNSVWTNGLTEPLRCPVAHAEGAVRRRRSRSPSRPRVRVGCARGRPRRHHRRSTAIPPTRTDRPAMSPASAMPPAWCSA